MLTGYVIAISLTRYSRSGFLVGRVTRIIPTYAAGYALVCVLVLALGDPNFEVHFPDVLTGLIPGLPYVVQTSVPADGIVWTLIVERVFYGVCFVLFRRLVTCWYGIAGVALGCGAVQWFLDPLPPGSALSGVVFIVLLACPFIPIMLFGVALFLLRTDAWLPMERSVLATVLAAIYWWLASTTAVVPTSPRYRWSVLSAAALFVVASALGDRCAAFRPADFMASSSYPLYVVHAILGFFVMSSLAAVGAPPFVALCVALVATVGCAWLLNMGVEEPTYRMGRRLARSLSRRGGATLGQRGSGERSRE